ncbi:MAG TPA: SDR family NAD(P)-dependent oxidoreductase, partial [Caldimonas sp.]
MANPTHGPFRDDALQGKRILITGGGTGLGKELARSFVAHGAAVTICGRREAVLEQAVSELQAQAAHGGSIGYRICDVRSAEQIEAMVESIWAEGPLTGLVNNAAANFISPSIDISPRGFEAVRSTVMDGALYATLACGRRWIAEGLPGSVVSMLVTWVWTG